jgi:ubiquitin-conjugating enzyme E2 variant
VERLTGMQRALTVVSIATACALWLWNALDVLTARGLTWWAPLALLAGVAAADLLSGFVHWFADTWGRDDTPIIGPRLLVPFRVHHVNPDDFLTRPFLDTNGDTALLTIPALLAAGWIPLETTIGLTSAVALLGLCGASAMTNQIHQWAHMSEPPRLVRWLQRGRLVLGHGAHEEHHGSPYDVGYCITTGWWNGPLDRLRFFRGLERMVTALTGVEPRQDDARYRRRLEPVA